MQLKKDTADPAKAVAGAENTRKPTRQATSKESASKTTKREGEPEERVVIKEIQYGLRFSSFAYLYLNYSTKNNFMLKALNTHRYLGSG